MKNAPIEMILSGPKCDEGMPLISTITSVGYDKLRESARIFEVNPQKKPRNPYRNRKKPYYRDFGRYLAV